MAVGQVGFKDQKKVKRIYVEERKNVIVNRLNKTKVEKHPDLRQEKMDRRRELSRKDRATQQTRVRQLQALTSVNTSRYHGRMNPDVAELLLDLCLLTHHR